MYVFKCLLSIFFLLLFFTISTWNNLSIWKRRIKKVEAPSWIPFIGGILGVSGILLCPFCNLRTFWWIPIIFDGGSSWGIIDAVIYNIKYIARQKPESEGLKDKESLSSRPIQKFDSKD